MKKSAFLFLRWAAGREHTFLPPRLARKNVTEIAAFEKIFAQTQTCVGFAMKASKEKIVQTRVEAGFFNVIGCSHASPPQVRLHEDKRA
jgi:hypothetical protein